MLHIAAAIIQLLVVLSTAQMRENIRFAIPQSLPWSSYFGCIPLIFCSQLHRHVWVLFLTSLLTITNCIDSSTCHGNVCMKFPPPFCQFWTPSPWLHQKSSLDFSFCLPFLPWFTCWIYVFLSIFNDVTNLCVILSVKVYCFSDLI